MENQNFEEAGTYEKITCLRSLQGNLDTMDQFHDAATKTLVHLKFNRDPVYEQTFREILTEQCRFLHREGIQAYKEEYGDCQGVN
jgi:hypothetical protein